MAEIRHLRAFVAVAEELSFGRAARRIGLSQPALSATIRQLEAELDVQLLHRTTRKVRLDQAGLVFLPRARAALEAVDDALAAARITDRLPVRLSAGVAPAARYGVGALMLARLAAVLGPAVVVGRHEAASGALVSEVSAGALDLALVFCCDAGDVERRRLGCEPAGVVLPASHPLRGAAPVPLGALRDDTVILSDDPDDEGYNRRVMALCQSAGFSPATREVPLPLDGPAARNRSADAVLFWVASGVPGGEIQGLQETALWPFDLVWRRGDHSERTALILREAQAVAMDLCLL